MKISLKKINLFSDDIICTGNLYKTAFPDDERAPFTLLAVKSLSKDVDFWSLYADGRWAGLAYVVNDGDLSYLFYYAVSETERGKGIGTKTLKALRNMYAGRRFFLALEQLDETADNYPERLKRRCFYMRGGLKPLDRTIREGKVVYDVMGVGGDIQPDEYRRLMENYAGAVFKLLTPGGIVSMDVKESRQ